MTNARSSQDVWRLAVIALAVGAALLAVGPPGAVGFAEATRGVVPSAKVTPASVRSAETADSAPTPDAAPTSGPVTAPLAEPVEFVGPPLPPAPVFVAEALTFTTPPRVTTAAKPGTAAAAAILFALAQRGLPYVWGGDGPANGDAGFDCSGLTAAAYSYAGITLPRTAHTQFYAGPHVPAGAPLEPGDLVFYGVPERVHHVGLYLGADRMINAPTFGRPVRLAWVRYPGDDYLGATRPAAGRDAPGLLRTPELPFRVPATPAPYVPSGPEEFTAPPALDLVAARVPAAAAGPSAPAEPSVSSAQEVELSTSDSAGASPAAHASAEGGPSSDTAETPSPGPADSTTGTPGTTPTPQAATTPPPAGTPAATTTPTSTPPATQTPGATATPTATPSATTPAPATALPETSPAPAPPSTPSPMTSPPATPAPSAVASDDSPSPRPEPSPAPSSDTVR